MSTTPNLELGRRFIAQNPPPGRILCCAVTGSHQYGFSSPDSDLDLKGIHLAPTESLLGLSIPDESFDRLQVFEELECDLTTNEAKQALSLLLRGNGNILERIFSPFQLYQTEELEQLRVLAKGAISKSFFGHYAGFFKGVCREHDKQEIPTAKSMLYSYRVALTGIHLLQSGELEANLGTLSILYNYTEIQKLMQKKRETKELCTLTPEENETYKSLWPILVSTLEESKEKSQLPHEAKNRSEISNWLVSLRKKALT